MNWTRTHTWIDEEIERLDQELQGDIQEGSLSAEQLSLKWKGRKQGRLKTAFDEMMNRAATSEEKRLVGQCFNHLKTNVETVLAVMMQAGYTKFSVSEP